MNGVINIYKEKGYTSHDAVADVRKILKQKRIGHTGTLDPEAEGVLPVCIGKATKAVEYLMDFRKTYQATLEFGIITSTQDYTGEILSQKKVDFDEEKIKEAVFSFLGEYEQIPPMYSAIKVNGKRLYQLAREGKTVERKARKVYIYHIDILSFLPPNQIKIEVECSKGTYIRTLCEDIGNKLGFGAYMKDLIRTKVGIFEIENSIKINELRRQVELGNIDKILIKTDDLFYQYNAVKIQYSGEKYLKNGNKIHYSYVEQLTNDIKIGDIVRVYSYKDEFIGLYEIRSNYLKPLKLFL
ncbi:MAG: tRNA pseudouridine(55) synthase TruB [Epulopiscium sp.]|nr:tRNA pseudouridine(55) synthase TruB [Candidatus Epulonipiscium sp.]HOQ16501.1 tRNA pseudouridine(55) synthase TruB [Defluviitaleaceae bacterium]HPT75277.1 tRNA pseudouridine(55) synthase TruB [Defluviitaleaceae bacterium]